MPRGLSHCLTVDNKYILGSASTVCDVCSTEDTEDKSYLEKIVQLVFCLLKGSTRC